MKNKKKLLLHGLISFLIPVFVMLAVYAVIGIYPFGDKSILTIDLNNQYVSYFSYLRDILRGNHGLIYSFSKTLGGDMIGLSAYYLLSPLNSLLLLFPTSSLPTAIEIITLVKIGLCGCSFFLCMCSKDSSWHSWIFSTAYALMSYNIVYQQNIMWMDNIILLPLMVLGIRKIFQKKSPFFYMGVLFFNIILNYYIGYMCCIFSVLYFLYCFLFEDNRERFWDMKIVFRYGFASAMAGGISMWLILPVLKSLGGGAKTLFNPSVLVAQANFHWSDFLVKLFPGSFDYEQVKAGLPNVFCGTIVLYFLALFFMNRKISIKKKTGALGLFVILYLSFYFSGMNLIWHGFNPPTWFPYRYSFVFSFLMLMFAEESFCKTKLCSTKEFIGMSSITLAAFLFLVFRLHGKVYPFMTKEKYLLSIVVMVLAAFFYFTYFYWNAVLDYFHLEQKKKFLMLAGKCIPTALVLVCVLELGINGVYSLKAYGYAGYKPYQEFVADVEPAVDYVKQLDKGFYRMEKTFYRKQCDPMMFRFKGLSHYSSTEKNVVKYFMGQMGFRNNGNWAHYNRGSTYAMDSLLSVKYILSKKSLDFPYQLLSEVNGISVYENPYSLPIGFLADEQILSVNIDSPHKFELQNEIWRSLCGETQKPLFQEIRIENTKLKNLEQMEENECFYRKKKEGKGASLVYTFTAQNNNPVFVWFGTNEMHPVTVKVNGKSIGRYFDVYNYDIMRLGSFEKGQNVEVKLILREDMVNITDVWFYCQDMEVFSQYYTDLSEGFVEIEKFSETEITGSVSSPNEDYVLFTIPQEEGWKAYIDGEEAEVSVGLGIFLTVKVPPGVHQIELRYIPAGLKTGFIITTVSAALTFIWVYYWVKRRKNVASDF